MRLRMASVVLLCTLLLHIPNGLTQPVDSIDELKVSSGDAIKLFVYEGLFPISNEKFLSNFHDKEFIVDGAGDIYLFSMGKLKVAGQTAPTIAEMIKEKFKPFAKDPQVIVVPLVRLEFRGGFQEPGMYRMNLNKSFWEALNEVGGLSGSRLEDVYIEREGEILYEDFFDAFYRGSSLFELGIRSGDKIAVSMVNRISANTIMRYVQFGMSILIFYFTMENYNK